VDEDISQLEELELLVRNRPNAPPAAPPHPPAAAPSHPTIAGSAVTGTMPRVGSPPRPQTPPPAPPVPPKPNQDAPRAAEKPAMIDELAFLKSVTEDEKRGIATPAPGGPATVGRRSGAQFQPSEPGASRPAPTPAPAPTPTPAPANEDAEPVRTLKCRECGTMNLPTEWYCESCGAELAAL
jgi:hypothetical protein